MTRRRFQILFFLVLLPSSARPTETTRASLPSAPGKIKAWTEGLFRLQYVLAAEGASTAARTVRVTLKNDTRYVTALSPRLTEHEAVHRRINEIAARRMETELEGFRTAGDSLKDGERLFLAAFRRKIAEAQELHRAWDATHTVP
ncbi:MAG TPA: hypothetical protein P5079_00160 [Elusimicrobiota bacterium]|nr:hypothetical protein [Elusimicrobiota bacterium]